MNHPTAAAIAATGFTLVSRADCHLCEQMLAELQRFLGTGATALTLVDVDGDEELQRRYGHKVPVLLHDGELVCHGRFDLAEVARLTRGVAP